MSDKWSLLILTTLEKNEVMRYKDLKNAIPDISQKMLSSTLKRLEEDKLIHREMYKEIPPRVEYSLARTGKELMPAMGMVIDWALKNFSEIVS
ncbi:MAG: helix-turn-helix domain-containing protein [Bacteroidales bacterium]